MSLLYMCIIFAITIVLVHGRAVWEWGVGLDEGGLFAGQPEKKKKKKIQNGVAQSKVL